MFGFGSKKKISYDEDSRNRTPLPIPMQSRVFYNEVIISDRLTEADVIIKDETGKVVFNERMQIDRYPFPKQQPAFR